MSRKPDDTAGAVPVPDLSGFGLDLADEEWLALVRRAGHAPRFGRLDGYELLEELSRGAQGIVYRAWDVERSRFVAVKRLLAGSFATEASKARFEREMETAAALQHPNIVTVYDTGLGDRQPLLVMEWIDGQPVDRWADAHRQADWMTNAVLVSFLKICGAVHHAHQRGVIHRDLKPSNILVDAAGEPHLLDFGLAKLIGYDSVHQDALTQTSDFIGTPAYAAPEQVRGEHRAVDVRTDVYALGVILFRMSTGHLPFEAALNVSDLLYAVQHTEPVRASSLNPAVDDDIDAVVGKALAKEPGRR